ncbi:hypothetical protein [Treponema sp.]|uniref:hypothetical protein n=1 Tax=Treponema sp. TaxID=166 RepID=UPI003F0E599F
MTRYAVLAGSSSKEGFRQKSLSCIYTFLTSTAGGAWAEKEILILPDGVDIAVLKRVLHGVAESGIDFLFLYFCGNERDSLTSDGFTVRGTEIKRIYIEETCKKQVVVYDACKALVSDEEFYSEVDGDVPDERQYAAARLLSDDSLASADGGLWLNCCGEGGNSPVLAEDGNGIYTAALVEYLCGSEKMLDFAAADRNARFSCGVVRERRNLL